MISDSSQKHIDSNGNRKYNSITFEKRLELLKDIVSNRMSIKEAASKHKVKLSTAKVILKVFKNEGRIGKLDVPEIRSQETLEQKVPKMERPTVDTETRYQQLCADLEAQLKHYRSVNYQLQQALSQIPVMRYCY